jgi:hypothetical protein
VILGGFPNVAVSGGWANSSGQIPSIPFSLIDADTPTDLYTRTGFDGETYNLVFSDEVRSCQTVCDGLRAER